jgi:hypothetical protein
MSTYGFSEYLKAFVEAQKGAGYDRAYPPSSDSPQDTNLTSEPRSHIKQPSDSEDLDKNG